MKICIKNHFKSSEIKIVPPNPPNVEAVEVAEAPPKIDGWLAPPPKIEAVVLGVSWDADPPKTEVEDAVVFGGSWDVTPPKTEVAEAVVLGGSWAVIPPNGDFVAVVDVAPPKTDPDVLDTVADPEKIIERF